MNERELAFLSPPNADPGYLPSPASAPAPASKGATAEERAAIEAHCRQCDTWDGDCCLLVRDRVDGSGCTHRPQAELDQAARDLYERLVLRHGRCMRRSSPPLLELIRAASDQPSRAVRTEFKPASKDQTR